MNAKANTIRSRLSLRAPQAESLEILSILAESLELNKEVDLAEELSKVRKLYPTCADFEREFPSLCFALATGVGKTRLMGAFISYLYLEKGIKNFFVMAPNLTVYNKLIVDFSQPTHPKYVFKGIGEFATRPPRVVTGDNYESSGYSDLFSEVTINLFNISKLNAESRGGKEPRMKRLQECLGDSYFNHLAGLPDLVLLMDESHHYRAERGMAVINELKPILGLELTATPQVERNSGADKFKNVVYEYSLAKAIRDGFVKEPAVATRKNFDPRGISDEELDRIKLEDGIRIHEDTKNALDIYARDSRTDFVKPFVLVVAKDTDHAAQLRGLIQSNAFFEGRYADKVMEIHSNQRGSEKEENIQQLLTLEDPSNRIEIVVHVNMLKEGWDVTNLYTIIPLRTAASTTLREQTIGRGLRLPYGKRTGAAKVDKLTIIAHDRFQEIVDAANAPDSIIRKENIIEIDPAALSEPKEVITAPTVWQEQQLAQRAEIAKIESPEERKSAEIKLEVDNTLYRMIPSLNTVARSVQDLKKPEVKAEAMRKVRVAYAGDLFAEDRVKEAETRYEAIIKEFIRQTVEIPKIMVQQKGEVKSGFHDFDLNTDPIQFQPVSEEIIRRALQSNEVDSVTGSGRIVPDRMDNLIVNEMLNKPEVDYDEQSELLFKLARQALTKLKSYLKGPEVENVVQYHKRDLADQIYSQMMPHFYLEEPEYEEPKVYGFVEILEHNFEKQTADRIHDFKETIQPTSAIPSKVFGGFEKSCHSLYKFDSKTEKDFACLLEQDRQVLKWLRPARNQFYIYYNRNTQRYEPDFVVETADAIFMVETKIARDIDSEEVQKKAQAALNYCTGASKFTAANGGKPWKYLLIPHDAVMLNMSFDGLARKYDVAPRMGRSK
ncbi:MAG: type III restriction endonuclease subunit R [Spartobacteria bacterium]|nr:type III restriction endonuclease subunit R [Spartobacteria bacterium]